MAVSTENREVFWTVVVVISVDVVNVEIAVLALDPADRAYLPIQT